MKRFWEYVYDHHFTGAYFLVCGASFGAVFALYDIEMRAIWYPLILSAVFGGIFLVAGFLKYRQRYRELNMISMSEATYPEISEILPQAQNSLERDYQKLIGNMEKNFRREREKREEDRREMEDYYAVWVHQIKAPIAVMKVMLQQQDSKENREISSELFRVEQYAEMALSYIRLSEGASDLVIQEYGLDDIIRKAVRKYAGQFIRKKLRLVYEGTGEKALTDEKWLSLIIEQILSNAVKYTSEGSVTIRVDEDKQLIIEDTGIGISPEDLPRIFEKGYTGYNGRRDKKATGIGLYLCRKAADKLGHKIRVESEPGKGSRFILDLRSYALRTE